MNMYEMRRISDGKVLWHDAADDIGDAVIRVRRAVRRPSAIERIDQPLAMCFGDQKDNAVYRLDPLKPNDGCENGILLWHDQVWSGDRGAVTVDEAVKADRRPQQGFWRQMLDLFRNNCRRR